MLSLERFAPTGPEPQTRIPALLLLPLFTEVRGTGILGSSYKAIAAAPRRVLEALDAPVDVELLRYSPEVQAADATALLAERVIELQGRIEALETARQKPRPQKAAE